MDQSICKVIPVARTLGFMDRCVRRVILPLVAILALFGIVHYIVNSVGSASAIPHGVITSHL